MGSEKKERNQSLCDYYISDNDRTLAETAEAFGLSRQRASQILKNKFNVDTSGTQKEYERDEIIRRLQSFYELNDEIPKKSEWDGPPSKSTIVREFGTWNYALLSADIPLPSNQYSRQYSKQSLIRKMREANKRVKGPLTNKEFSEMSDMPSGETIRRYFGSWNQAKVSARIPLSHQARPDNREYTKETAIVKLGHVLQKRNYVTREEWDEKYAPPSSSTIKQFFDSWKNAVRHAIGGHLKTETE